MSSLNELFGGGFQTNSMPPQTDFPILPPGNYPVIVEKAEVKVTKKGDGHYLSLTLGILDGPNKGRKLFDRINIQNPNQQCTDIGLRCLAALGQALGLSSISTTEQLLSGVCLAHVKVKDEENEIRTYSSAVSSAPASPPVAPPYSAPAPQQAWPAANTYQPPQPAPPTAEYTPPPVATPTGGGIKPPWAR